MKPLKVVSCYSQLADGLVEEPVADIAVSMNWDGGHAAIWMLPASVPTFLLGALLTACGAWEIRRTAVRGTASRGRCPSVGDDNRKGEYPLLSTSSIYRTGGLAASPGSCRIIAGSSQNLRKWE
jgi:hypothetical protein